MIVTGKHLPRRTFLRGLGAAVALPMLDSMVPAFARPSAGNAPTRLLFTYIPSGATMAAWIPQTEGKDYEITRILKPIEAFRSDFSILSGLDNHQGEALGDGPGDHARAGAAYLTGDRWYGYSLRHFHRSNCGKRGRVGNKISLARTRRRRYPYRRRMRFRL
jgi:hypothetical protein